MKLTDNLLSELQNRLKVGNRRGVHLNALPGRSRYKFDVSRLSHINKDLPNEFITALLSENPFNSKIEKGIKFIVENSHKDGGWSLLPGEKEQELYVTYFALNALSFYQFLKKRYVDEDIVFLRKYTTPQVVATMLYKEFDHHLKKRFAKRSRHQILSSKALGSTQSAVNRRIAIIKILSKEGTKDVAEVIDSLKDIKEYSNINKKAYMTQIKLDLEYLRDANFVSKFGNTYYMFCDIE